MAANLIPASFDAHDANVATGPEGQIGHRDLIEHTAKFERKLHEVRPGVWSMVGNGLSNQNFVEGPDGLIVIDTGESVEEMAYALAAVREHTSAPIAAVMYTHFHYVGGTKAVLAEAPDVPIWGHAGIVGNLQRIGADVSAAASRGLVHQFGMVLPSDTPDSIINVGLGLEFRRAEHAPFTPGFVPPTETFETAMTTRIAGLDVEITPAPSDADDSATFWFPELELCVHNLVWPTLFNVFAIRGEEYRDPRILVAGIDHIASLSPEHLVATHGPPLSGKGRLATDIVEYRDSIQFLWDQTVRGINRGLTVDELTAFVQLPNDFDRTYLTRQFYGVAEHHVRQIHAGLRGWFDGHDALLFPVPPLERAQKLIAGFGGADEVRTQARQAVADGDHRWALELASWLVRSETDQTGRIDGGSEDDRNLLAEVLRSIGQRTTSSNVRNWCMTRALELEGTLDLARFRVHRFGRGEVMNNPADLFVRSLRLLLDPGMAEGIDDHLRWEFEEGTRVGLHVRRQVAVPTDGASAELAIALSLETWADILSTRLTVSDAIEAGRMVVSGEKARVLKLLGCFDHTSFIE